jgi:hypothetical protein
MRTLRLPDVDLPHRLADLARPGTVASLAGDDYCSPPSP